MEEELKQCQGPDCTKMIQQISTGSGHREQLYCGKNCRMAASRARQRAAEEEAERQRLAAFHQPSRRTVIRGMIRA